MKIEIEISDDELREHILVAAGNALHKQYSTERNLYKRTMLIASGRSFTRTKRRS